ncbi:hypothetical protein [Paracoccus chinensis]|uniref:Uncharacterized protein n=1 Tax=Paracoccus chinensis TaxID=525640 RepID=A0A1G9M3M5_9RHOB|nr:hypothetical protein [Paracoccus chinensis]SDL68723.1 hypothetical protein SAMN04487971_1185 [Paracoccus chinensis]
MKIAVCFFGLSRALATTHESIARNVIEPCRRHGETVTLAHLYHQARVQSARSGENADLDPDDYRLLDLDAVALRFTVPSQLAGILEDMKPHGDAWDNGFSSLSNLIRQLYSLSASFKMAQLHDPDIVLFCRPDLIYHDSLEPVLETLVQEKGDLVALPDWHHWKGGYNDRFALCRGIRAAQAYAERLHVVHDYVARKRKALHSERLLRFALERAGIPTMVFPQRASRVRAGGLLVEEKFWKSKASKLPYLQDPLPEIQAT